MAGERIREEGQPGGTAASAPKRILIVEDDEDLAALLERWVADYFPQETKIHTATNLEDGADTIDRVPNLDVVLLDRHFPRGTGDDLLEDIHAHFDPIVVMITGVEPESNLVRLQVSDYLVKPVDRAALIKRLSLLDKLETSGGLTEYANARKASLLEFHLDDPEADPLYRRFAARWQYDRLEVAVCDEGAFVYELYTGDESGDRTGHVEVSVVGSVDRPIADLVEEGELAAVGELVPSGDGLAWIEIDRSRATDPPEGGYTIYEFTTDTPEDRLVRGGASNVAAVERDLEEAFG